MKKNTLRIITIVATILAILCICSLSFAAKTPTDFKVSDDVTAFDKIGGTIVGAIQAIGNIVAVGILVVLGIKYMMGSAEEKAEYKKVMIPYLIGAALIFAASNIAQMVYQFAHNVSA